MRSFLLSAVLGVASLGFLGALPSSAEAGPWRAWRDGYYSTYYYPPTVTYYSAPVDGTTVNYSPTWTTSSYTPSAGATVTYTTPATTYYYPTYRTYYYPRRVFWTNYSPVYYYP